MGGSCQKSLADYTHRPILIPVEHLHLELTDGLPALLDGTSNFCEEVDGGWLGFGEDVDVVGGHSFLGNEDLFGAVDDEVTAGVVGALVEIVEVLLVQIIENAIRRPQHDGNLEII